MEIVPATVYDVMKRYWRRRRYQRLDTANNSRKKLKVARFGGTNRRVLKIKLIPRLRLKIVSPIKLFAKFHDAYVDMMIRLATGVGRTNNVGVTRRKGIPKDRNVPTLTSTSHGEVDSRLVLEIYKRLAASRELSVL